MGSVPKPVIGLKVFIFYVLRTVRIDFNVTFG